MQLPNKKQQYSVYISNKTINKISAIQELDTTITSRNVAIEKAIDFYYGYLSSELSQDFLCSVYGQKVEGVINGNTERLSRLLFKNIVETNVLSRLVASHFELSKEDYEKLRLKAISDARSTRGVISVYEAQE